MKRRTFIVGSAAGALTQGTAHAQRNRTARQLRAAAEREERRLYPLSIGPALPRELADLAAMWLAVHAAQEAENAPFERQYGRAVLYASGELSTAVVAIEAHFYGETDGRQEALRVRDLAFDVRRAVLEAAARHAPTAPQGMEFWRCIVLANTAITVIAASALLHDREGVADAVRDLRDLRDNRAFLNAESYRQEGSPSRDSAAFLSVDYWMSVGHSLLGQHADAYRSAKRDAAENPRPRLGNIGYRGANLAALAYACANVEDWRAAWEHLLRLRGFGSATTETERVLWSHFDAAAALVSTWQGTQLWFADRFAGWRQSRKFDLPALSRFDLQRFAYGAPEQEWAHFGWSWVILGSIYSREASRELRRRLAEFNAHCPPGFAEAFAAAMAAGRAVGARRVAWLSDPVLATFPTAALSNGVHISSISSLPPTSTVSDRIQSVEPLRISGGDENIPLARVERDFVSAISPSPARAANWALHISSHSRMVRNRLEIKTGARSSIGIEDLKTRLNWRHPPRLVVLSACNSAVDRSVFFDSAVEARIAGGPARELLESGVPGVIGTLWQISDTAAFFFGARLYAAMISENAAPRDAYQIAVDWLRSVPHEEVLRYVERLSNTERLSGDDAELVLAQIVDRQEPIPFADPYYWAAWTYWGV